MSRHRVVFGAVLAMTVAAGCRGTPPAVESARPAEPPTGTGAPTAEQSRVLCLAEPGGASPADQDLRTAQGKARLLAAKSDEWVAVGRQWVRKARQAADPGFYVNVSGCAAVALELEAGFVPALALRTLVLMNDHAFDEARLLAEDILGREPENLVALGTLSDALLELGRYDEAAEAAQRQMSARPGMAAYARGSYIRWLRGDTDEAKIFIRDALIGRDARDPEPAAWTFVEAATIFWHQGDYDGADAVFAEALKWVPDYPSALVGRARIAMAKGRPGIAVELLEKAYRLRPLAETAWLLGDAHEMRGDGTAAAEAYDSAVQQGRRGDRLTLALFYATKDREVEEALRLVGGERAARGGVYVDDVYAWALYRARRLPEARAASERAIRLGTKDARLLYHAGAIRIASGDESAGRKLVRRALALNPHFDRTGAAEARRLLADAPRALASNRGITRTP
jgi:tetratricopeptide (TPR) repeat protein